MEWNNGSGQPHPANKPAAPVSAKSKSKQSIFSIKTITAALVFCIALLVLAILLYVIVSKPSSQGKYVDSSKMQAVFLNGGQVYFGKIGTINSSFMRMTDIYYLRVNQQVQPDGSAASNQDISLVKLGCELHGPQDSMVINQQQVIFWENLKGDGQVAKAVEDYVKQNPNGQQCNTNTNSGTNNTNTNTNNNTTTNTNTNSNSTTKKP